MRAFTKTTPAILAALAMPGVASEDRDTPRVRLVDPLAHNVGAGCGCGTGGPQVCTPTPGGGYGGGYGGGGIDPAGNGSLTGTIPVPPTGDPGIVPLMGGIPVTPPDTMTAETWARYVRDRTAGQVCIPYSDAIRDCVMMTRMATAPTVVGIGATVNVDFTPPSGWADIYYVDVVALSAEGIDAGPTSFNATRPTVVGCPNPPCDTGVPVNGRFWSTLDNGCCCGRPFRAIVPPTAQATPLRTAVTNLNAAAITVQYVYYGFCFGGRICV